MRFKNTKIKHLNKKLTLFDKDVNINVHCGIMCGKG